MGCSPWGRKELGTTEQLITTYLLLDTQIKKRVPALSEVMQRSYYNEKRCLLAQVCEIIKGNQEQRNRSMWQIASWRL